MSVEALVAKYGLVAIFLGSGIEGEAVVVTGGILAHKQFVPLWAAMVASATGSCIVDQLWFFLGRHCRDWKRVRAITEKPAFDRALRFFERHPTAFVLGFRFVYGMRTISPIAIGTTRLAARRFVPLNALAAAVWGPLFTYVGYAFGEAIDPILRHAETGALIAVGVVIVMAAIVALAIRWRRARKASAGS